MPYRTRGNAPFCDVHRLSASERESMERATAEINAEFAAIYEKATPKFDFQSCKIRAERLDRLRRPLKPYTLEHASRG